MRFLKPRGLTCASKDENATEEARASRAPAAARAAPRVRVGQPRALAAPPAGGKAEPKWDSAAATASEWAPLASRAVRPSIALPPPSDCGQSLGVSGPVLPGQPEVRPCSGRHHA